MKRTFTVTVEMPDSIPSTDDWRLQQIIATAIEKQPIRRKPTGPWDQHPITHLKVTEVRPAIEDVEEIGTESPGEALGAAIGEMLTDWLGTKKTAK